MSSRFLEGVGADRGRIWTSDCNDKVLLDALHLDLRKTYIRFSFEEASPFSGRSSSSEEASVHVSFLPNFLWLWKQLRTYSILDRHVEEAFDLVLLVHVLYYFEDLGDALTAAAAAGRQLAIVHSSGVGDVPGLQASVAPALRGDGARGWEAGRVCTGDSNPNLSLLPMKVLFTV